VYLAGTFNGWDATALPMSPAEGGEWYADIELAPGSYEFKFVVDGEWGCEPGCEGPHTACAKCIPNAFGTMNRTLVVT
jgi:1,4-alpha-glucan branching enzyme